MNWQTVFFNLNIINSIICSLRSSHIYLSTDQKSLPWGCFFRRLPHTFVVAGGVFCSEECADGPWLQGSTIITATFLLASDQQGWNAISTYQREPGGGLSGLLAYPSWAQTHTVWHLERQDEQTDTIIQETIDKLIVKQL